MASTAASRWQTVWGLAVALVAGIVLLVVSQFALLGMSPGPPLQRTAALLGGTVALLHVAVLLLASRSASLEQAGRDAARVLAISPPLALLVTVPLEWGGVLATTSLPELLPALGPVLAAVWGVALGLAPVCSQIYQELGGPAPGRDEPTTPRATWSLLFGCCVAAAGLFALGPVFASAHAVGARELWPVLGQLFLVLLFGCAGGALARDAGVEVAALARRLDRVDERDQPASARPLVTTRLDAFALLQADLERLRRGLREENRLYQETLAQTREAAVAKAEFLAAVSHELRTPLNSICGFSQLLLEGMTTPLVEEQREDIRLIRTSGMHLLALINDILDISMIESGELRLYFLAEAVPDMIDEVVRQHRPLVQEAGLELRTEVASDLPRPICDRRRICQILHNLLSNATKFTERGSITVAATYDPLAGRIVIRVVDTGVGIAAAEVARIFEEYHQVGNLSQRKKGTGLGLAIARSIAFAHGGSLEVSSAPGRGSTFTLSIPLDPPRKPTSIDMTAEAVRASQRVRSSPSVVLTPPELPP